MSKDLGWSTEEYESRSGNYTCVKEKKGVLEKGLKYYVAHDKETYAVMIPSGGVMHMDETEFNEYFELR